MITDFKQDTFEKLVQHVSENAFYNETYKNVNLIGRYFSFSYQLLEFPVLRNKYTALHREAEDYVTKRGELVGDNPFYKRYCELEKNMFDFIESNIGEKNTAELRYAYAE